MTSLRSPLSLVLACALLGACSKEAAKSDPAQTGSPAVAQAATAPTPTSKPKASGGEAKQAFKSRCAVCHGEAGKGDGPGATALNPKPRDYTDKEWQKTVTDEDIKKTILYGGAAVGKSPNMPSSPDLDSKPELVEGLVLLIRSFGK